MRQPIKLPPEWLDRSRRWAERSVAGYARGEKEHSRQYARPGIDKSIAHQLLGKAAECAYCLHAGIDPATLDWSPRPDCGWDIRQCGLRIDVKGTRTEYLMWPVTKNGFLHELNVDVFVLVRQIELGLYDLAGWSTVPHFIQLHHIATAADRLDPGTKYLHFSELPEIRILGGILKRARARDAA